MSITTRMFSLISTLVIALVAGGAGALPVITIDVAGGAPAEDVTGDGTFTGPDGSGVISWSLDASQAITEGGGTLNSWTVTSKDGAFLTNNVNLTNTTGSDQVYEAKVFLSIAAFNYSMVVASSVGATITDQGNGSLLLDEDGATSFYRGQVNSTTVLTLNPGTPLDEGDCLPFPNQPGCSASGSDDVGAGLAVTPGVANDIALVLRFSLSPGDSVGITSRFEIVPEPTTGMLLGLGLLGLAVSGRRRS